MQSTIIQYLPNTYYLAFATPLIKQGQYIKSFLQITLFADVCLSAEEVGQLLGGN